MTAQTHFQFYECRNNVWICVGGMCDCDFYVNWCDVMYATKISTNRFNVSINSSETCFYRYNVANTRSARPDTHTKGNMSSCFTQSYNFILSSMPIKYIHHEVCCFIKEAHERCNEKARLVSGYKYINGLATSNEFRTLVFSPRMMNCGIHVLIFKYRAWTQAAWRQSRL